MPTRWAARLSSALLLLLLVPGGAACMLEYSDAAGDTEPPLPGGGYDLVAFQAVTRNGTMWWRVQAVGLEPTTTEVQYVGQIDTGEREGAGDGTSVQYHPICPLWIQRSIMGLAPDCHLSRSHVVGNAVRFEMVGPLEAAVEPGGWLNVTIPYGMLGVDAGAEVRDLRSSSQVAVSHPGPDGERAGTISPIVTDRAGTGEDVLVLCPHDASLGPAGAPGKGDGSSRETPGAGLPLVLSTLALAILRRRGAP